MDSLWEYVEIGISGTKEKRPELDRMMQDAYKRKFDSVIVWKFDRFARSVSHLLRALETFNALGIHFVSLSESLDTSTLHCPRRCRRTGAFPHRGESEVGAQECSREREETGEAN